jgi:uncharacterized membrane protein YbhN (UPF0104 family)
MSNPIYQQCFKWAIRFLYASLLVFLSVFILRNFEAIKEFEFSISWLPLISAFMLIIISYTINCWLWLHFAKIYGVTSNFLTAGKAWTQSQLGKYIPGKVSVFIFRISAYPQDLKSNVAIASAYEYITNQAASCIIILISISLLPLALPEYLRIAAIIGIVASLVLLLPTLFIPITNKLFTLLNQPALEKAPAYSSMLMFVSAYSISLFIQSAGLYLVIISLTDLSPAHLITIVGMYQAAALAGIFAVFTPAGLGVREGILVLIVPVLAIPEPVVIVSVLLMRLLTILAEIVMAAYFNAVYSISEKSRA